MEVKIVIFLAFTSVTLIFNAVVIFLVYKLFSETTLKVRTTMRELQISESALVWLNAMEYASSKLVSTTDAVKNGLVHSDPALAGAQARYGFRLAKLDVQIERSLERVLRTMQKVEGAVARPAHRVGATLYGVREVLNLLADEQTEGDATSRPKQ